MPTAAISASGPVQETSDVIYRRAPKVAPSGPLAGNVTLEGAVLGTNGVTVLDDFGARPTAWIDRIGGQ